MTSNDFFFVKSFDRFIRIKLWIFSQIRKCFARGIFSYAAKAEITRNQRLF